MLYLGLAEDDEYVEDDYVDEPEATHARGGDQRPPARAEPRPAERAVRRYEAVSAQAAAPVVTNVSSVASPPPVRPAASTPAAAAMRAGRETRTSGATALAPALAPTSATESDVPAHDARAQLTDLTKQRDSVQDAPTYRITTLQPRNYNEARQVGEAFRDGTPVIMNLTEMDDRDAKRLVDFAAGLVFGLRGSIEKVTAKVFLLTPRNVSVTAEDKALIREGGFFNQS
jgi:cell division inhibitor SepF